MNISEYASKLREEKPNPIAIWPLVTNHSKPFGDASGNGNHGKHHGLTSGAELKSSEQNGRFWGYEFQGIPSSFVEV